MPARLVQDARRLSVLERSILPFLAPAILQPWPLFKFRSNSQGQAAVRSEFLPEAVHVDSGSPGNKLRGCVTDPAASWKSSTPKQLAQAGELVESSAEATSGQHGHNTVPNSSRSVAYTLRKIPFLPVSSSADQPASFLEDQGARMPRVPSKSKKPLVPHRVISVISKSADGKWDHQRLAWSSAYRRLDVNPRSSAYERNTPYDLDKVISDGAIALQLKRSILKGLPLTETWKKMDEESRRRLWQPLMLWALRNAPYQSLRLIRSTYEEPLPWAQAAADSLDYTTNYLLGREASRSDAEGTMEYTVEDILSTLDALLSRHSQATFPLQQRTIYLLIKNGTYEQTTRLYRLLDAKSIHLHEDTILHFLSSMTRHGNIEIATTLIRVLVRLGTDLNSKKMLKACTSFFQQFMGRENRPVGAEVLSLLMAHGFKPNVNIYNVLISNACKSNQHFETEKLLSLMKTQGIQPDAYTHSIILNKAKSGHQEDFQQALASFQKSELPQNNPYVNTDILHSMLLSASSDPLADRPFDGMLAKFKTVWNIQALEDLGILSLEHSEGREQSLKQEINPEPPIPALSIMLSAFLDSCKDDDKVVKVYQRFRELVERGQPLIVQLVKTDFVPNAFLARFRRGQMDLDLCVSVPEAMMKERPTNFDLGPVIQAQPTIQTWSILIATFLDRGLVTAVDVVMKILKHHQLVPTKATWDALISGLSELQRVEDTAKIVQQMRDAGHDLDHRNLQSLNKIRDREGLLKALEGIQSDNIAHWSEDSKGRKLERVNPKSSMTLPGIRPVSSPRNSPQTRAPRSDLHTPNLV